MTRRRGTGRNHTALHGAGSAAVQCRAGEREREARFQSVALRTLALSPPPLASGCPPSFAVMALTLAPNANI